MRSIRCLCRIALVAGVASAVACEGDETNVYVTSSKPSALDEPQQALAQRVAQTQVSNGSWYFQQVWYDPIDYTNPGLQNVTGVTALGLIDAYSLDLADNGVADDTWFAPDTLARAKDYLIQWMNDFINQTPNPSEEEQGFLSGSVPTNVSNQNFLFCKHYEAVFGLTPAEAQTVDDAFSTLLALRDATYGTDPTVISDGIFNRTVQNRTNQGIPYVIGWDEAYFLRTLVAMDAPQNEIDWVQNALKNFPTFDVSQPYGIDSVTNTLNVLNLLGDTSMNATLVPAMQSQRNPDGSYVNSPGEAFQSTAYALMALKALSLSDDAKLTQQYLEARVGVGGVVFNPANDLETYEVTGEILWSCVLPVGPVGPP